ncbi:hypothetical protein NB703_003903 [Pantoea ananatis]|uniref:Uncharacterized protein n=1 Tax=Pantoea ananas TaxID=553 RepID=A0AAJ1FUH1_PANAN|nr:hypothetical protein [Pantoea ananatis]MCW0345810.1 hypothetical protein [Pantoea ananatis]
MIKAKDFFALPPAERQLLMSQHDTLKISLGVHAEDITTSRLQDIANGTKVLEQADLLYNRDEPGVEYLVLKIRG